MIDFGAKNKDKSERFVYLLRTKNGSIYIYIYIGLGLRDMTVRLKIFDYYGFDHLESRSIWLGSQVTQSKI